MIYYVTAISEFRKKRSTIYPLIDVLLNAMTILTVETFRA